MSNAAIYQISTGKILYFVENCIRTGDSFHGTNMRVGVRMDGLAVKWTDEKMPPVVTAVDDLAGYEKTAGEVTASATPGPEIKPTSHADYAAAIKLREVISNLSYSEIDGMVDSIFPALNVAQRTFLKNHAKATLAIARIMDRRI